jgi:ferritin-like metal-binding protein YciE
MPAVKTLENLFEAQLHDIYFAENKLVKALPKMAKKATDKKLEAAFLKHERETKDQIAKLERVMNNLGIKVKGVKCEAILGIIKEADEMIKESKDPEVRDAALIAAGQKAEHYEIATYGSLCTFAQKLGHPAEAKILHSILEQETRTDEALTELAESGINERADKPEKPNKGVTSWLVGESHA